MPKEEQRNNKELPWPVGPIFETTISPLKEAFLKAAKHSVPITAFCLACATTKNFPADAFLDAMDRAYAWTRDKELLSSTVIVHAFFHNVPIKAGEIERQPWSFFQIHGGTFSKKDQERLRESLLAFARTIVHGLGPEEESQRASTIKQLQNQEPDPSWRIEYLPLSRLTEKQKEERQAEETAEAEKQAATELYVEQKYAYHFITRHSLSASLILTSILFYYNDNIAVKDFPSFLFSTLTCYAISLPFGSLIMTLLKNLTSSLPEAENTAYLAKNREECKRPAAVCALLGGLLYSALTKENSLAQLLLANLAGGLLYALAFSTKKTLYDWRHSSTPTLAR